MSILYRSLFFGAVTLLVILAFLILYGKNGYLDQRQLNAEEQLMINESRMIEAENQDVELKIERLKSDLSYIEHIARHELGMLAEDELVFRFQDVKQPSENTP
ncbi:FtsB family cell division protein [Desulfamplus magnetovallimortis]|uniref:FtsB family cell division protein n=1 Tax=Desulfamplus magnetovallimortis TaxID=1246637 RepID=UPI0009BAB709|nr:septum formation initiator family protein [Desulfamplus magnetovallimortis]